MCGCLDMTEFISRAVSVGPQASPHVLREEDFEMIGGKEAPLRHTRCTLLKEGYLTKQGGFFPSWKRRWYVWVTIASTFKHSCSCVPRFVVHQVRSQKGPVSVLRNSGELSSAWLYRLATVRMCS
jgi:hypothetical protein